MDVGSVKQIGLIQQTIKCSRSYSEIFFFIFVALLLKLWIKKFSHRIQAKTLKYSTWKSICLVFRELFFIFFRELLFFPALGLFTCVVQRIFLFSVKRRYKMTKVSQLTRFLGGVPRLRSASAAHVREFLGKEVCFVCLRSSDPNQRPSRDAVH